MTKSSSQNKLSDSENSHGKKYQFYQKNQIVCAKVQGYPPWPAIIDHPINDYGIYKVNFIGVKNYWANSKTEELQRITNQTATRYLKQAQNKKYRKFSLQNYQLAFKIALEKLQKQKKLNQPLQKSKPLTKKTNQKTKKITKNRNSTSRQVSQQIDTSRQVERSFIDASESEPIQMRRKINRRSPVDQNTSQERSKSIEMKSKSNQKITSKISQKNKGRKKTINSTLKNTKKKYYSQEEEQEEVQESPLMQFQDQEPQQKRPSEKIVQKKVQSIQVKHQQIQSNSQEEQSEKQQQKVPQQSHSKQQKKSLESRYKDSKSAKIQNKQIEGILSRMQKKNTTYLNEVKLEKNKQPEISGNQIYDSSQQKANEVLENNSVNSHSQAESNKKIDSQFLKLEEKYKPFSDSYFQYYQKHSKLTFANKIQLSIKIDPVQGGHQYQYKFNQLYQCLFISNKTQQLSQVKILSKEKQGWSMESQSKNQSIEKMQEQGNHLHQSFSIDYSSNQPKIGQNKLSFKNQKKSQDGSQQESSHEISIQKSKQKNQKENDSSSSSGQSSSSQQNSSSSSSSKNQKKLKKIQSPKKPKILNIQKEEVSTKKAKDQLNIPSPFKSPNNADFEQKNSKKKNKSSSIQQINNYYKDVVEKRKYYPENLKIFQNKLSKLQNQWDKTDHKLWKDVVCQIRQYSKVSHHIKKNLINSIQMEEEKTSNFDQKRDQNKQIERAIRDYHRYRLKKHTKQFQDYNGEWIGQTMFKQKHAGQFQSTDYQQSVKYIREAIQLLSKYFLSVSIEETDLAPFEQTKDNQIYRKDHKHKSLNESYVPLAKFLHQSYLMLYFRSIPIELLIKMNVISDIVILIETYNNCNIRARIVQNIMVSLQDQHHQHLQNQDVYQIFKKVDQHYICRVIRLFVELLNSFKFQIKHVFKPIAIRNQLKLAKTKEERRHILKNLSQSQKLAIQEPQKHLDQFYKNQKFKIVQNLRRITQCMQKYKEIKYEFKRGVKFN